MSARLARLASLAAIVLLAGACGGRADPPASPDNVLVADAIGIAVAREFGPCQEIVVTLESGDTVTALNGDQPQCDDERPRFLFGGTSDFSYPSSGRPWLLGRGPLVFAGTDDGRPWLASVDLDPGAAAWCFRFARGDGAHRNGNLLHMTNGLVVPLAADFTEPTYPPDAFPLRSDDLLCLNASGEAVSVSIWIPY